MTDVFIAGAGSYVPRARVRRGDIAAAWRLGRGSDEPGTVAACLGDEDSLTLAVAASREALDQAAGPAPDALFWGTGRAPFAEGPNHALLRTALGLADSAGGCVITGSPHAGVEALAAAWDCVAAGHAQRAIVVCSEDPMPGLGTALEANVGAAAAAVVLSAEPGPAQLIGRVTYSRPQLDRYRGEREIGTRDVYDPRLYREYNLVPGVTHVARGMSERYAPSCWTLPDEDGRLGRTLARTLGVGELLKSAAGVGYCGAAAGLLGAMGGLRGPGVVGMVAHGGGRTSGVAIKVTAAVPGAGSAEHMDPGIDLSYVELLRHRGHLVASGETVPMAVPPGSAMHARGGDEILQMLGSRCDDCGSIATPPSAHPRCLQCGGARLTTVPLARDGVVHTYVVNETMPAPFVAPLTLAVVDLDDGARVMLQAAQSSDPVAIGDRVRLVLRRYATERGASVYGYKIQTVRGGS